VGAAGALEVRKLTGSGTNAEGWAHYTEQMMLDEGYGAGRSQTAPGPIAGRPVTERALHRGIEMHTGKMTFEQGVDSS